MEALTQISKDIENNSVAKKTNLHTTAIFMFKRRLESCLG